MEQPDTKLREIFSEQKPIIGMIALPPLVGYAEFPGMDAAIEHALADLQTFQDSGIDGVCVENDYDRPHQVTVGPEIVASFTRIAQEVARHARVPVGLQVLLNDWRASIAIAKTIGASFVRLDFFVDRVRIEAGIIEPEPLAVIAYRKEIQAENIALFTDIQVKYSELLEEGKTLATSAQQAFTDGADAIVVTGRLTGEPPTVADLKEARSAISDSPLLIGSGLTAENAGDLMRYADGAIVGTAFKNSTAMHERIQPGRVHALMAAMEPLRHKAFES